MRQLKAVVVVLISAVAVAQERDVPDAGVDGGHPSRRGSRGSDDRGYSDRDRERAERERAERERERERAERDRDRERAERDRERDRAERERERYHARRRSGDSGYSGYSYSGDMTSVLSGKTLGGGSVVHAQFGWPGISATLLTSASQNIDVGARVSLLYAYEGITSYSGNPGLKFQGVLRLGLLERGKLNLGLEFAPGFFVYSEYRAWGYYRGALVGLTLPVGLAFGFALSPNLMLSLGLDVPIFYAFGDIVAVPVRLGMGLEYALDRSLALTLNVKAGPSPYGWYGRWDYCWDPYSRSYYACGDYSYSGEALIGLSYRL
jgi:hypothetical protein